MKTWQTLLKGDTIACRDEPEPVVRRPENTASTAETAGKLTSKAPDPEPLSVMLIVALKNTKLPTRL
ncbi:hypothetical protein D3C77_747990 [compost metagenome]